MTFNLFFKDDEDDDPVVEDVPVNSQSEEEEESEPEEEPEPVSQEIEQVKASNPFFNKFGRLKRKFVEDEAELSGSEEDSGK